MSTREERAAARSRTAHVSIVRPGDPEPAGEDGLAGVALGRLLTETSFALAGVSSPSLPRSEWPIRVVGAGER